MKLVRMLIVAAAFASALNLTAPASATGGWNPGHEAQLLNGQTWVTAWAQDLGKPQPQWVNSQGPCITNPAQFCNGIIYIAPQAAQNWANVDGWLGIWFLAGHEASHAFGLGAEDSATCGAGVFFRWLVNRGTVSNGDVLHLIGRLLVNTSSDPGIYGTAEHQQALFRGGYERGSLTTC